ncbi:hypothetical protein DFR47_11117 [Pseudochrobactrum asaccharolyticum]|uniref:Uncharacterized protein n=1 Tax=Pseudochrobactrum asaccharolyticum TaxID=354351 RepID=A0A366DLG4_9HYPH|nr:hypothetical protein DFR47_11117 [Pseudochrobactrum asaccharolyticum]
MVAAGHVFDEPFALLSDCSFASYEHTYAIMYEHAIKLMTTRALYCQI